MENRKAENIYMRAFHHYVEQKEVSVSIGLEPEDQEILERLELNKCPFFLMRRDYVLNRPFKISVQWS